MRKTMTTLVAMLMMSTQGHAMDSLSSYGWKNRILLVFGPNDDKNVSQQIALLKAQAGELAERDMVVLQVSGNRVLPIYGKAHDVDAERLKKDANAAGDEFQTILVGKDGGVKLRSKNVVGNVEMFDLIDRMPMRRSGG